VCVEKERCDCLGGLVVSWISGDIALLYGDKRYSGLRKSTVQKQQPA
jgi:hypothetical protein